jgi:hypothetical protein
MAGRLARATLGVARPLPTGTWPRSPAGGLRSTARDLLAFLRLRADLRRTPRA